MAIEMADDIKQQFAEAADGDARRLLNLLEIAVELAAAKDSGLLMNLAQEKCFPAALDALIIRVKNFITRFQHCINR